MSSPTTIHRQLAGTWNRRAWPAFRNLFDPECTFHTGDGVEISRGPDARVEAAQRFARAFPDGRLDVRTVFVQGNSAVAELIARGTHEGEFDGIAPTHRSIEVMACSLVEMRDGRIYREREYVDRLQMFTQLGVVSIRGKAAGA